MSEQHVTQDHIVEYLHGQLPPDEDALVKAHIAGCAPCADSYQAEARLTDLLREHARAEERDLPPGVVASIRAAIAAEAAPRSWWSSFGVSLRPYAVAASIVLGLLAGAYFSFATWHSHAVASTIDGAYFLDDHAALAPTTPFGEEPPLPTELATGVTESDERPVDAPR